MKLIMIVIDVYIHDILFGFSNIPKSFSVIYGIYAWNCLFIETQMRNSPARPVSDYFVLYRITQLLPKW